MEKSIDHFLFRTRRRDYDCLDFACDVWAYLVPGDDRLERVREARRLKPQLYLSTVKFFEKIPAPVSPCIVMMHKVNCQPHIGIFYAERILHLPEDCVRSDIPRFMLFDSLDYYR